MSVRIDTKWSYRGFQVILLENHLIRVVILPELGAKIWEVTYKPSDRNLLWHHPRIEPRMVGLGQSYDDNWAGGWDELFPNDEAVRHQGEEYPDHGELWCQPWEWEISKGEHEASVLLSRDGAVTPTRMEKRITLREGESQLRFEHRLTNLGSFAFDYLWKLHPALRVSEHSRIDLPVGKVIVPEGFPGRIGRDQTSFVWPFAQDSEGKTIDMRRVPPKEAGIAELLFGIEVNEGWCALTDTKERIGFGLAFPKELFSTVWVFASYGGWRDLYTVVLEPCTAFPVRLDEAARSGRCTTIQPGETVEAEVRAVVFDKFDGVERIDPNGSVIPV